MTTSETHRIAGSVSNLAGRRVALLVLSAAGMAAVTRLLGPTGYGVYAAAVATWTIVGAVGDWGFSLVLARDLATDEERRAALLRASYEIGVVWSLVLAVAIAVVALATGATDDQGLSLLVLAPSIVLLGLAGARQVYMVLYRTRELALIDIITVSVQLVGQVAVAALGWGPVAVAAVLSVTTTFNALAFGILGRRIVGPARAGRAIRRSLIAKSAPLGLNSVMTKTYLMADLVILGFLVSGPDLGNYGAAAKMLTLVASVPGLITNAALPAFARAADDRAALQELTGRIWHWMLVTSLPVLVVVLIFPRLVVDVTIGPDFREAAGLLQILVVAGVLGVACNLLGTVMVAKGLVRPMLIQNAVAIVVNVAGNFLLVPKYGVAASAWLTVLAEVIVGAGAIYTLRRHISFEPWIRQSGRPILAALASAGAGALALALPVLGVVLSVVVFGILLWHLGAWPEELRPRRKAALIG